MATYRLRFQRWEGRVGIVGAHWAPYHKEFTARTRPAAHQAADKLWGSISTGATVRFVQLTEIVKWKPPEPDGQAAQRAITSLRRPRRKG